MKHLKYLCLLVVIVLTILLSIGGPIAILALVNIDPRYLIPSDAEHVFPYDSYGKKWWVVTGNWIVDEQNALRRINLDEEYFIYESRSWSRIEGDGFCNSSTILEVGKIRRSVTLTDLEIRPAKFPYIFSEINQRQMWTLDDRITVQVDHVSDGVNQKNGLCINPRVEVRIIK